MLGALRLTPAAIIDAVKSHEFVPYEEPEESERPAREKRSAEPAAPRPSIDIPLDGEERPKPEPNPMLNGV